MRICISCEALKDSTASVAGRAEGADHDLSISHICDPQPSFSNRTGMAAPITCEVDGKQYNAFGGGLGRAASVIGPNNAKVDNAPIMFVFTLDGTAELPAPPPPAATATPAAQPAVPAGPAPEQRN